MASAGQFLNEGRPESGLPFLLPISLYQRVFERTARGLYFFHTAQILPASTPVEVTMLTGEPLGLLSSEVRSALKREDVGSGAFIYHYCFADSDPNESMWLFAFHGAHWASIVTGESLCSTAF